MKPMAEKTLNTAVAAAIASSKSNFKSIKSAGIAATVYAAAHGRCVYMDKLYNGMAHQDGLAFKSFVLNLNAALPANVFTWSKTAGFGLDTTDEGKKARKELQAMTPKALQAIEWISQAQKDAAPVEFSVYIRRVMKKISDDYGSNANSKSILEAMGKALKGEETKAKSQSKSKPRKSKAQAEQAIANAKKMANDKAIAKAKEYIKAKRASAKPKAKAQVEQAA